MNILITGGTGLIGASLLNKLADKHDLTILTKRANLYSDTANRHYVSDLEKVDFNKLNAIVNLAGEPIVNKRWSDEQKDILCASRWDTTQKLVDKINDAERDEPLRFISGSAVGYYGRQDQRPITESYNSCYAEFSHMLCQRWEQIALSAQNANVALLRTGIVLSKDGGALKKMLLPFKMGLGGPVASGHQMMPWIHIDDMVNGILFLLEQPELTGPFNLTAPEAVTNREFSSTLAKVLGRPCLFTMPEFVLRLAMGEMADLLVYGQNPIPQRLQDSGFLFAHTKLNEALTDLLANRPN